MSAHWILCLLCALAAGGLRVVKWGEVESASAVILTGSSGTQYREYSGGSGGCSDGDGMITSSSRCREAAQDLGRQDLGTLPRNKEALYPGGCFTSVLKHLTPSVLAWPYGIYFNTNLTSRRGHSGVGPLCLMPTPAPAPAWGGAGWGGAGAPAPAPALSPIDFDKWMSNLQKQHVPMGGFACGYGEGWCGCACGHNKGEQPCHLPQIQPGTAGGFTCGRYGVLYGCAEAHNNITGCPTTRNSVPAAYGGSCPNGQMRKQSKRNRENHCKSCNSGYSLTTAKTCQEKRSHAAPAPPPPDSMPVSVNCGKGYLRLVGDIVGWGQIATLEGGHPVSDCTKCRKWCNKNQDCGSYECSARQKMCNLNIEAYPQDYVPQYEDYAFCQKIARQTTTKSFLDVFQAIAPTTAAPNDLPPWHLDYAKPNATTQAEQVELAEHADQAEQLGQAKHADQAEQAEQVEQAEHADQAEQAKHADQAEQLEQLDQAEQAAATSHLE